MTNDFDDTQSTGEVEVTTTDSETEATDTTATPEPEPVPEETPAPAKPEDSAELTDEEMFTQHLESGQDFTNSFRTLNEGDVVRGEIVRIDREGVLVDVGQKSEGLIKPQEIGRTDADAEPLAVGDSVDVMVIPGETADGQILLSKKRADFEKAWDHVIEAFQNGATVTAMVTDRVKGGLTVDLGIRGFIPASHVGNGKIRNLEQFIGQALPLKVIEVDKERRKVVLSHRLATEGEREKQRESTLEKLAEGQICAGVVRRITDYGAFVDLGGVDGLLHISEMSWSRIKHPSEVVRVNQDIQVMVLKVSKEQGRISLGMRQILPDPWAQAAEHFKPGDTVEGKVSRLVQGGAFLALEGGIEGFIRNSELAQRRVSRPEDVVKVGDTLSVKVLEIRADERRIELSRKALEKKEERDRDDRTMREFRSKQTEEHFTLGAVLGEALRAAESDLAPEEEAAAGDAPVVDEAPVVEETPAVEDAPVVEEAPAVDEAPAVEEITAVEEAPAVEEAVAGETTETTEETA